MTHTHELLERWAVPDTARMADKVALYAAIDVLTAVEVLAAEGFTYEAALHKLPH